MLQVHGAAEPTRALNGSSGSRKACRQTGYCSKGAAVCTDNVGETVGWLALAVLQHVVIWLWSW